MRCVKYRMKYHVYIQTHLIATFIRFWPTLRILCFMLSRVNYARIKTGRKNARVVLIHCF